MLFAVGVLMLVGCGAHRTHQANRRRPQGTRIVAAMAPLADGGLRVGDLRTGRITDVLGPGGVRLATPRPVATVRVSVGGQRGLLGLAAAADGRTFAAFTRPDGRLVVARVSPGAQRLVWLGPPSRTLADGGHLAFDTDGRLLIGVGDLQNPPAVAHPSTPNGKLLSLDPGASPAQRPRVLSLGWNNPYAFTVTANGRLVVADNAPGKHAERIADGRTGGGMPAAVTSLPVHIAPSGLAALGDRELAVCGVVSGRLDRYRATVSGHWRAAGRIAPCRYGVVRLTDGRLAISGDAGIEVVRP